LRQAKWRQRHPDKAREAGKNNYAKHREQRIEKERERRKRKKEAKSRGGVTIVFPAMATEQEGSNQDKTPNIPQSSGTQPNQAILRRRKYRRERYSKKREHIRAQNNKWDQENYDQRREYFQNRYQEKKEQVQVNGRNYYQNNREKVISRNSATRQSKLESLTAGGTVFNEFDYWMSEPAQQAASTDVFLAQSAGQEQSVARKGAGRPASRHTHTPNGEPYFGTHLRELREQNNWTIEEAADKLGYSESSVRVIEGNHRLPSDEKLMVIAEVYGTSVDELKQFEQHPLIRKMPFAKFSKLSFEQMDKRVQRRRVPRFDRQ
jgi:transcriptional regulator with XRE-family HTH domain